MKTKSITIRTTKNQEGETAMFHNGNPITIEELTNLTKSYQDAGFEVELIIDPIL